MGGKASDSSNDLGLVITSNAAEHARQMMNRVGFPAFRLMRSRYSRGYELDIDEPEPEPHDLTFSSQGVIIRVSDRIRKEIRGLTIDVELGRFIFLRDGVALATGPDPKAVSTEDQAGGWFARADSNSDPAVIWEIPGHETIDLSKSFQNRYELPWQAQLALEALQEKLPAVVSAYEPSGKLPNDGVRCLALAFWYGTRMGLLVGGAAISLVVGAWIVTKVTPALTNATPLLVGLGSCLVNLVVICIGVISALFAYPAIGVGASLSATDYLREVKNRNVAAAIFIAAISTLAAVMIFWAIAHVPAIYNLWNNWLQEALAAPPDQENRKAFLGHGLFIEGFYPMQVIGLLAAIGLAVWMARSVSESEKFCEHCQAFMEKQSLLRMTAAGAAAARIHLQDGDLSRLGELIMKCPSDGQGRLDLFSCEQCSRGLVDLSIRFRPQIESKRKYDTAVNSEWIIASRVLAPDEVAKLRQASKDRYEETSKSTESQSRSDGASEE